ncbi:MAG TPA: 16S rRNA (guanine(527)-N(7))-methyltransferase RsmG [Gammaproteobacteria bacterium]
MRERIFERLKAAGVPVGESEAAKLADFLALMSRWNAVHNLTSIKVDDELIDRHLLESLAFAPYLRGARIADVGSGAGLPGIPLAITNPDREFTLIESRGKRASFLEHARSQLALSNVHVVQARAEALTPDPAFATVLARAVAAPRELVRITQHLLDENGILLVLTRANFEDQQPAPGFTARIADDPVAHSLRGALVIIEAADS